MQRAVQREGVETADVRAAQHGLRGSGVATGNRRVRGELPGLAADGRAVRWPARSALATTDAPRAAQRLSTAGGAVSLPRFGRQFRYAAASTAAAILSNSAGLT